MAANRIDILKSKLNEIDAIPSDEWIISLEDRKIKEMEFHDEHRDHSRSNNIDKYTYERFYGNKKYYLAIKTSTKYMDNWIVEEVRDRVFLDYCCGDGGNAIRAALAGAKLAIGIDLSSTSISNARNAAAKAGVSENTYFVQADAEDTKLPENSIERAICSGVLHHVDLARAFTELHRILITGGKILAHEALDYNPAIKLYRHLTPAMRTEWEKSHILSMKDVKYARKFFEVGEIRFWHILTILQPHFRSLGNTFQAIDNILTKIPFIQLMAWMFTFELIKRGEKAQV